MSDLSDKFTALESQLSTQQTAIMGALGDISDVLGLLNTALDTLNNNGATNTKALLTALGGASACIPCPTPDLTTPPVATTTPSVNQTLCKRIQAFLHAVETILTIEDAFSSGILGFNPQLIIDAVNQAIVLLENPDTTPPPSWIEAGVIAADLINFWVNNVVAGHSLVSEFASIELDVQDAMFAAGSIADMQSAYNAAIEASGAFSAAKPVLKQTGYTELFNYYFDPASNPNLTGYDGTICSGVGSGCTDLFNGLSGFGDYDSGTFSGITTDYVAVGIAGGGGGTVGVYINGSHVDDIPVSPTGHAHYYTGAVSVRTLGASGEHYFMLIQKCYGTTPANI